MIRASLVASVLLATAYAGEPRDERPISCESCAAWNSPRAPFRVHGNTYFVGVAGLSSVLVETSAGLVLLDGALPQSAQLIAHDIAALGHDVRDVKLILTSHAHFDHVGGVAALKRLSGARVVGSASTVAALAAGHPTRDDPQYRSSGNFPVVAAQSVRDGETITVGDVAFTAHLVPGHTPGATTWTWKSCDATGCVDIVYADSLNAVSDDGFRFSAEPARVATFRHSIDVTAALSCDVLLTVHPELVSLDEKVAAHDPRAFVDETACRRYAEAARTRLTERLAQEARQRGRRHRPRQSTSLRVLE